MPLSLNGPIMCNYNARSEVGIRAVNIRYRVIPKGVQFDQYPEEYKRIQHPREDPNLLVYDRLPLTRVVLDPKKPDPGPFIPDLGIFERSLCDVPRQDLNKVNVEFYPFPSRDPANDPGELEAGGRRNFEVSGLLKKVPDKMPDGTPTTRLEKIDIGDTVELYIEVLDKVTMLDKNGNPVLDKKGHRIADINRPAGYSHEAKRKIVMPEVEVMKAIRQRDEAAQKLQDKLRDIADDQASVFRPKKK
jgi:hypothetical protein